VKLLDLKQGNSTAAECMECRTGEEHLELPQNLYDSAQRFRPFPLMLLECSQSLFTRKAYLSYCTTLSLATRFFLKVKSFPLSSRPTMKISSIPHIYSLTLRCSIIMLFLPIQGVIFVRIHKKQ
jgi:hypothetical protein